MNSSVTSLAELLADRLPIVTDSPEGTEAAAIAIARQLLPGTVIALHGTLGAGKTVFAHGFAKALGITEPVSSPTFTLVQEYAFPGGTLYHLDLYRIDNSTAALAFGVDEFLYDPTGFCLVEWPERIMDILPPNTLHLMLRPVGRGNKRELSLFHCSPQ